MQKFRFLLPTALMAVMFTSSSCSIFRKEKKSEPMASVDSTIEDTGIYDDEEEISADTVNKGIPLYQAAATRLNDIIHMDLAVSFDFDSSRLFGKAILQVKPWFYPVDSLILDAKAFDIASVKLVGSGIPLKYIYDGYTLRIGLDKQYNRNDKYSVAIDYTANPEKVSQEGSDAISKAKGLYFINPKGQDSTKPTQVWTQGETESNSCWFPTIDKPNEKITHQIAMTVPDRFKTLSNGLMVSSVKNKDGNRTDTWRMDMPHAPYLVMMAIGEYSIVKDKWRNIQVDYYVEKEYEPYARKIFGNTPEMIEFFSKKLGIDFPWQKYAQVVVRDYVSGAMENTTATLFGEFVQQTPSKMLDNNYEGVIAHELFHHWFGDLVTCESWSNLPLNESFANYAEYLWTEYKYGRDEADYLLQKNMGEYFEEYFQKKVSLIRFDYKNREDMFDRHSYQKGGAVLHMLRKYLGDDAFFEGLKLYLNENRFQAVEIHQLRIALEKVCGEDLNWFFNQWFLGKGHPYVEASWSYNPENASVLLKLKQIQNTETNGLYKIPLDIAIYQKDKKISKRVVMDSLMQSYEISLGENVKPNTVIVDAEHNLVGRVLQELSMEEAAWQLQNAPLFIDRYNALEKIMNNQTEPGAGELMKLAMRDRFWDIRQTAINGLDAQEEGMDEFKPLLMNLASTDRKSSVRAAAIDKLNDLFATDTVVFSLLEKALNDSSMLVQASAISGMYNQDKEKTIGVLAKLEDKADGEMLTTIMAVYADAQVPGKMPFMLNAYKKVSDPGNKYYFIQGMGHYALSQDESIIRETVPVFEEMALNESAWWLRLAAIQVLAEMKNWYDAGADQITADMMTMKEKGTSVSNIQEKEVLKASYKNQSISIDGILRNIRANEKDPNLNKLLNLIGE